jgi:hypothetical protein
MGSIVCKMQRHSVCPPLLPRGQTFPLPSGFGAVSFLVTFDDGRIYAQAFNQRLTKGDVAKLLKTTEEGIAYLAKKGCLKPLGHPDESKQKLFSAADLFLHMQDTRWLGRATDLLYQFAEEKNASQAKRRNNHQKE